MASSTLPATLFVATALATLAATGVVQTLLRRHAILDHPNERSSHRIPTPRGGGLAVTPVAVAFWLAVTVLFAPEARGAIRVPLLALALGALSWIDDRRGLSPLVRLVAQGAAVGVALPALEAVGPVFQGLLPPSLDLAGAALLWLWFINLFNFMDGIDGIAGTETAAIGTGLFLVTTMAGIDRLLGLQGLVLAGAAVGFLYWNWHPARIFLGDVGSIPLGFLLGWALLVLAAQGQWAPALILPLIYLADATITLGRRLLRGAKVWQAHREHFYQRAATADHGQVVMLIAATDSVLVLLALIAVMDHPWLGTGCAAFAVAMLLVRLGRTPR